MPDLRSGLFVLLTVVAGPAAASPRALGLREAVELAMALDPSVAQLRVDEDRGKLGILRAQLDRVSLRVDGQLQELWNKSNIGAQVRQVTLCTVGPFTSQVGDAEACRAAGGTASTQSVDPSTAGFQGLFNLSANLSVPLFTGFRITSTVKRAELLRESSTHSIRQLRRDVALSVARAYWSVRRFDMLGLVHATSLERMKEGESVAEGRLQAGLAPPIDRNRARSQRLQQEAALADVAGAAAESAAQLAVALGIHEDLALTDPPLVPESAPPPVEELLRRARSGREELKVAELQLLAQKQAVRIARSAFFPQLSAFGLFQVGNNPFLLGTGARSASQEGNPFANVTGNLTVGASLTMNFFDTLNTWTTWRDQRYLEARLDEDRRRAQRLVESDVRLAHARVARLVARRRALLEAAVVARDNLKILEARYRNGDSPVSDLLQGHLDLNNVELQLADLTAQLQLAALELQAALGELPGVDR